MSLLEVQNVTMRFGGLVAVKDIDLTINEGQIKGVIGPNGAGKTTLFNIVTGVYIPTEGDVTFQGKSVKGRKPHQITRRGIARTFQNIRLFSNMTAIENVMVGADAHSHVTITGAIMRSRRMRRSEKFSLERAGELLERMKIGHLGNHVAKNLSYGDQRRVEIARALATGPRLLLLDEPAAGMNPAEKASLMRLIREIRDMDVTILLIEHDMKVVMGICEDVAVLDFGQKIAEGAPEVVRNDPRVIEAYLGAGAGAAGEAG